MLSAMTTSENFALVNRSRCSQTPGYDSVMGPAYVATILRQNLQVASSNDGGGGCLLNYRLVRDRNRAGSCKNVEEAKDSAVAEESSSAATYKSDLEGELTDWLDQLDLDDSIYEHQSKQPLKIDPNLLKLDFSRIAVAGDLEKLEKLRSSDFSENERASHHLSGGTLLTDPASHDGFSDSGNRLCKLSGGGLLTTGNGFEGFDVPFPSGAIFGLPNQISPSTPLTFDLTSDACGASHSTNPFKKYVREAGEDFGAESTFSPTNPFSDFCLSASGPKGIGSGDLALSPRNEYENVSPPGKSFSQCSTRPASPVLRIPQEESAGSNPFLVGDASPESARGSPEVASTFFGKESGTTVAGNSNSFIFAVPVFSFLTQRITDSSTQTVDSESVLPTSGGGTGDAPIYQNLTNHQLKKFVQSSNDHSEYDLQCLKTTLKDLRNSGWYYENASWKESAVLLRNAKPGTFLIRDSSDPNFLFSLSVQTCRGPTSVRLHYVNGRFRLDAEDKLIPHMPTFDSVIELIDHYVENTVDEGRPCPESLRRGEKRPKKTASDGGSPDRDQVWIDSQGNVYSSILLVKPLQRKDRFPSLQHLSRLAVNAHVRRRSNAKVKFSFRVTPVYESSPFQEGSFQSGGGFDGFCPISSTESLPIPRKLIEYLQDYPYCH